ncbi:hypothetical protein DSCO28_07400 [Desulfosarcina ovata subsp. sediminis]|uniref:HeH/LEM domain-containing protein n=1 Tax=Desulfosarcina ovata subsp. sediminis TaxID=885957 RepID=A0A5K7ZFS8_9BACT|nr:HeH/LEM domain-containing protein [Desulfosarcina ovata]BBO80174.1 hypothetical protein DSCO28_07400 [Desulfosarcina ovata subsp. sediminis]
MDVIVTGKRCIDYNGRIFLPSDRIEEMEDKEALRLIEKGHVKPVETDAGVIAVTPPIDEMKVPELKALMDKLGIAYPADAKKPDLVALVKANTAEPPKE